MNPKESRRALIAAIEAVGARVVRDRGDLRLSYGTFPVLDIQVEDNGHALHLIDALARHYAASDPEVGAVAHYVAGPYREPLAVAQRVQGYVQGTVPFVEERRERFQHPMLTLRAGGDCDDHAILVGSLLGALGVPARAEPIYDAGNRIVHTADRAYIGGAWRWAETTLPAARWDEHPRDAAVRLGVARSDILG